MADEWVVDASVAAKLYFTEDHSDLARAVLRVADHLIAPELLFIEMASLAAKQARRGLAPSAAAANAVNSVVDLIDEAAPLSGLAPRAFALAEAHGFSAYDATYLALAEARGLRVITADDKLARKAAETGLSHLVRALVP
jgi:predicted nucleic acid-binding protein